ncbi:MAG TPA: hypothetical protein VFG91_07805 [Woeseiaceae bacterium]|nr:hypothetical protein [Woeseiaceae bacterium]
MSDVQPTRWKRVMPALPLALKSAGALLLIFGLQGWAFQHGVVPRIAAAEANLAQLRQEAPTDELMNDALSALGDCWRLAADEGRKRRLVALRDTVMRRFADNPAAAAAELGRAASELQAESEVERSALEDLRAKTARLQAAYSDDYGELLRLYSDVPWYFQPGAAIFEAGRPAEQRLAFNHAQYLMLTGNREAAGKALDELRQSARSASFSSRVLFAQARLSYDAYRAEANVQYYDDALQYIRQSLRDDPDYALPKLFLEFLLSVDQDAMELDVSPVEAQGSGEAQGERGDISSGSREF